MQNPLPPPSPEALDHSRRLARLMQDEITAQGGWISFARFMELVLYAPGLGYYTAGSHKLGEAGDFITAPELSSLFGRTLARQVQQVMVHSSAHILELGAGSGKLARDMLAELERLGSLPERYSILEVSADLRQRQQAMLQQHLPHLYDRVQWLDALPESYSGAVVANEVLDALPVHLVHSRDSSLTERGVVVQGEGFAWAERDLTDAGLRAAAEKIVVPDDYLLEICTAAAGLIHSLASRMRCGAMLFIDYGFGAREFYHAQRSKGTLMCHYRHHAHDDPFYLPGLQDITAHVDFSAVAEAGIDAGLSLIGYTNQAFFLINSGITELMAEVSPDDLKAYLPLSAQMQKLTSPAEMGDLFKVIAMGKGMQAGLSGFARGDLSRAL